MKLFIIITVLLLNQLAMAAVEVRRFDDPAMEQRYHKLITELRCLVCQNQNLADSNAELAQDLRKQVYEMLLSGKSDQAVIDFMVQRYGDFVLYRPRVKPTTLLLWIGPFLLLLIGLLVLFRVIKQRNRRVDKSLSTEEQEKIRRMLDKDEQG